MAKRIRWTYELVIEEAKSAESRSVFAKSGAYNYARKNNLLGELDKYLSPKVRWTHELVMEEAKKYDRKQDFRQKSNGAYHYAILHNILDDVCKHIPKERVVWSYEMLKDEALKYNTIKELRANSSAYAPIYKRGLIDDLCNHMDKLRVKEYSIEDIKILSSKCDTKEEFAKRFPNERMYAVRNNMFDEVTQHMEHGGGTDADMIYVWRIPNTNIYKIGLSSVRLDDERIKRVAVAIGVDYEVITMCEVKNAFEVETELHNTYQIVPTTLPKKDGHTEFRILTTSDVNEITYYLENVVGKRVS